MWCLFLLTRKASLLGEFLSNLSRLGLLRQIGDEDRATAKLRAKSYIQRFEARYGGPPNIARKKVLKTLCACSEAEAEAHGCSPKPLSTGFVPVVLATVLITFGWIITLPPWSFLSHVHFPIASPIWIALRPACNSNTLAFRGAYFFSLQMLFRRYVLKDLSGAAYIAISIRIVMAVIGIWAVATLAGTHITPSLLNLMGFAFGMFPRVIWQVVATSLKRAVGVIVPSLISQLPLSDLDGLTVWHEARLEEEDVENIPNMATADLVDLFLDTRLAPERLIDWTDHAILFTQLGPQEKGKDVRHALRALGIRTATSFLEAAKVECREDRELLNGIISPQAKNENAIRTLAAALTTNPNLRLVQQWHVPSPISSSSPIRSVPRKAA
jgi:hypothetical protein